MLPVFNVNGLHDIGMPVGCSERDGRSLPPARYMTTAMQEYGKRHAGKKHTSIGLVIPDWLFIVRTCSKQLLLYLPQACALLARGSMDVRGGADSLRKLNEE